ncbi:MAG: FAD-binding domain-containing protein, partial [Pseudomonadota bacterium]
WRTYFKGFLERRPTIWSAYRRDLQAVWADADRDGSLAADLKAAEDGRTGIDAFDHWANELTDTGYLHNHARMWFASIWIFTLRLPWQAGADFFLRHLLDGDPASNTLSWRWVGGLHTKGRTYLARADNIARYTEGRFAPCRLAPFAEPLSEEDEHPLLPVPRPAPPAVPAGDALTLIHEDDCAPETLGLAHRPLATLLCVDGRSERQVATPVAEFAAGAVADAASRNGAPQDPSSVDMDDEAILNAAQEARVGTIVSAYATVGPVADRLALLSQKAQRAGLALVSCLRPEDANAWVYADRGFFKMKKAIPKLMA